MRTSLIRCYACIISLFSAVRAFNVTVGTPTQCDDLAVTWTGGQAPFEILLISFAAQMHNISVPASAFSGGQGSYSISLILAQGTSFLLTMSDATGFGSGGVSTILTVGAPVANNNCNTSASRSDFYFNTPLELQQCSDYYFTNYEGAVQPVTIVGVIPGERFIIMHPPPGSIYHWIADVEEGAQLVFFMIDFEGRMGGASPMSTVAPSTDSSCLAVNSSSLPTASALSQMPSQSTLPSSDTSTVGIIAGVMIGGVLLLVLLIILGIYYKRKTSRASDVNSSPKRGDHPTNGTLFALSKDDPQESASNEAFTMSASTCYMLHGTLVMIHIVLVISYIFHSEHHVTFPFTSTNDDFWSGILSASLQAFYTIYTAVLLFLTQRLAISRTLVRRTKLTSIHDISGAWSGLGSALSNVWQQIDIPASWWTTSAVAAYLACVSVLHVTSSTLLQLQTFNTTLSTSVPTALGWRNDSLYTFESNVNWGTITASLPVVDRLPGLVSAGIYNATVYDIPQINSMIGTVAVNATTISTHCGLLPGTASSQLISEELGSITPPWPDQIQVLQNPRFSTGTLFLMVSTSLDTNASAYEEFSVPMAWEYSNTFTSTALYNISVYFVQCSFSTETARVEVDMQTNSLLNPVFISQPSMRWEMYQSTSEQSATWPRELCSAFTTPFDSGFDFIDATGNTSRPSFVDEYIMALVGLDLRTQYSQYNSFAIPNSTYILTPDKLEAAVAHTAAQLVWIAGRIGASGGGFDIGSGTGDGTQDIIALRLNINLLPLLFAASASVIMLGLALHMTKAFDDSRNFQPAIPNTGALQLLWLGHHSAPVHEALDDVKYPTDANLRRAGMIDVCFVKPASDEEGRLKGSTDSLSRNSTDTLCSQVDDDET